MQEKDKEEKEMLKSLTVPWESREKDPGKEVTFFYTGEGDNIKVHEIAHPAFQRPIKTEGFSAGIVGQWVRIIKSVVENPA